MAVDGGGYRSRYELSKMRIREKIGSETRHGICGKKVLHQWEMGPPSNDGLGLSLVRL